MFLQFSGESKNIEYKVSLFDKSEKYMKTIVAFANIFSQMGLVEAWGSEIKRIFNAAEEYGILIRYGSPKNGYWEIVDKELQE